MRLIFSYHIFFAVISVEYKYVRSHHHMVAYLYVVWKMAVCSDAAVIADFDFRHITATTGR